MLFLNNLFLVPCIPVIEAIVVEVHSYIMFFLSAIVTSVLVVELVLSEANPSPKKEIPVAEGATPPAPSPDGNKNNGSNWKKYVLIGLGVVGATVLIVGTAGYVGWGDPFAVVNCPGEFWGAGVDNAIKMLHIQYDPVSMNKFLRTELPNAWLAAVEPSVINAKLAIAKVPQGVINRFEYDLMALASNKSGIIDPIMRAYPQGACELTLRAALMVSVNDKIDCLILEYATGDEYW